MLAEYRRNTPSTKYKYKPQIKAPLELHSRATPSVEAHQRVNGPNTGRNSRGRQIKNNISNMYNIVDMDGCTFLKN